MGSEAVGQARWSQGPSRKQTLPLSRAGVGGQGLELPPPSNYSSMETGHLWTSSS